MQDVTAHLKMGQVNRVLEVTVPRVDRELNDLVRGRSLCHRLATTTAHISGTLFVVWFFCVFFFFAKFLRFL